jgi:NADPH:quinone reductase-like Zn-dependent oxidoreductase
VDYIAHVSLYNLFDSLCAASERQSFSIIFDCVCDDTLFHRSLKYVKVDGKLFSMETGPFGLLKFTNWHTVILVGTPRNSVSVFSSPTANSEREVAAWFNKCWIKEVPVDSLFAMEDVLEIKAEIIPMKHIAHHYNKAFENLATQRTAGKIIVKVEMGSG